MANVKKFSNPVVFPLRIESETKEAIESRSNNKNDYINAAILEKIARDSK